MSVALRLSLRSQSCNLRSCIVLKKIVFYASHTNILVICACVARTRWGSFRKAKYGKKPVAVNCGPCAIILDHFEPTRVIAQCSCRCGDGDDDDLLALNTWQAHEALDTSKPQSVQDGVRNSVGFYQRSCM